MPMQAVLRRLRMSSDKHDVSGKAEMPMQDEYRQLVVRAWSAVFDKSKLKGPPPPLGEAVLRKQLQEHLIMTPPEDLPHAEGLKAVEALLQWELQQKDVVEWQTLSRVQSDPRLALWRGDITSLRIGAVVNAANEQGLGCFQPTHRCIDNVIHCAAGPSLRRACAEEMERRGMGSRLPTGQAMVTAGFCLPASYVIHTPGPVGERPKELAQCYRSVLESCAARGIRSVAFCCISTGLFGYPAERAAEVAVGTVRRWLDTRTDKDGSGAPLDLVVFDVFLESDFRIYRKLLGEE